MINDILKEAAQGHGKKINELGRKDFAARQEHLMMQKVLVYGI